MCTILSTWGLWTSSLHSQEGLKASTQGGPQPKTSHQTLTASLLSPAPTPPGSLGHPSQAASPSPYTWLQFPVPHAQLWAHGPRQTRDSRPTRPYSSNQGGTAGPGRVSALCRRLARRCRHKARMDTPAGRWPGRRQSRPSARNLRARCPTQGASFVPSLRPERCGLCPRRGPPAPDTGFRAGHKGGTDVPAPRPSPGRPGCPEGAATLATTKGAPRGRT